MPVPAQLEEDYLRVRGLKGCTCNNEEAMQENWTEEPWAKMLLSGELIF